MVVAGHVSPAATVVPHHYSTVLARKEVAVGLPFIPVLIQLTVKKKKNYKNGRELKTTTRETLKCLLHSRSWFILTRGFPSDQRKSPSMVLSFSPIHWYSLYLSQSEKKKKQENERK